MYDAWSVVTLVSAAAATITAVVYTISTLRALGADEVVLVSRDKVLRLVGLWAGVGMLISAFGRVRAAQSHDSVATGILMFLGVVLFMTCVGILSVRTRSAQGRAGEGQTFEIRVRRTSTDQ